MDDGSWATLKEPWQRLQWARRYWQTQSGGATTARAAAESLGIAENTYSAYERSDERPESKHIPLTHQRAIEFGNKFKINWVWILTGDETPFTRTPAQQRAIELLASIPADTQEEAVDIMETVIRRRAG